MQLGETVVDPQPLPAAFNQPRFPQVCEMAGCSRLRNAQGVVDVADTDFAAGEKRENPQPRGVRERPQCHVQLIELVVSLAACHIRFDKYSRTPICCGLYSHKRMHREVMDMNSSEALTDAVRARYGRAATAAKGGATACCETACCGSDAISRNLYNDAETRDLPQGAVAASLGCGNPTALIDLRQGDIVLDLGSGGGIDVLLSAKRVGPTGKAYGVDMTPEMLELARSNQREAGVTNVEFLEGRIDAIPLPDASVDVIISNCVINLAADKDRVLREAFRVLKPGGRFAVSDVVVLGDVPGEVQRSMELWIGCIAGALRDTEYARKLASAGFSDISVEQWRVYEPDDARDFLVRAGVSAESVNAAKGKFASAFVRASKPAAERSCCGPNCCA